MINHARSLILNKLDAVAGLTSGNVGAELIDSTFAPLVLPDGLAKVRTALLPDAYTPYQTNCILSYIMRILHMPDLVGQTLLFDSRFTYDLTEDFTAQLRDSSIITDSWQTPSCDVTIQPIYTSKHKLDQNGDIITWVLTHDPSMGHALQIQRNSEPPTSMEPIFRHKTAEIVLIPGYLTLKLNAPTGVLTGNMRYTLTFYAPVEADIQQWLRTFETLSLQHGVNVALFDPWEPYVDEVKALQNIWLHGNESLLRVGVFILGYVFQCERIRRGLYVTRASTLQKVL